MADVDPQAVAAQATAGMPLDAAAKQRVQAALSDALSAELARGAARPDAFFGNGSVMGLGALEAVNQQLGQAARPG